MRRAYIISANTFREALRQKLILLLALVALGLVASSNYFLKLDLGHERLKFVFDFTSGALGFFGSIIAIVATCQLFHSEFENRTAITLLSKPVGRLGFACGKAGGAFAALALFCAVVSACGCAMIALASGSAPAAAGGISPNYAGIAVFAAIQWAKLCAIASVSALVCSVSTSLLFSVAVSLGIVAICSMGGISDALGAPKTFMGDLSAVIFPNLKVFNASEAFAFGAVDTGASLAAFTYAAAYSAVCLALSAWAFTKREF